MRPYKSIVFALVGISIAIFGLSLSIVGLAFTQVYSVYGVNAGAPLGAIIALVGVLVALASAISLKE